VFLNTLAPLVLRIALAGIFIYHGLDKITGKDNDQGAAWAAALWTRQSSPPESVLAMVDKLPRRSDSEKAMIKDELREAYSHELESIPATLNIHGAQMAVAWGELVCGILLLFGLLTRLSALLMIVIQVGAIFTVTWARGFSFAEGGGFEYNLALIGMCLATALMGGGLCSLDWRLTHRWRTRSAVEGARVPVSV
jgi:uncharacterized membrane protein YphA (DoxX/SURF4 family)